MAGYLRHLYGLQPHSPPPITLGRINYNFNFPDFPAVDFHPSERIFHFSWFKPSRHGKILSLAVRCLLLWTSHARAPQLVDDLINHLIVFDHLEKAMDLLCKHHLLLPRTRIPYQSPRPYDLQATYRPTNLFFPNLHPDQE